MKGFAIFPSLFIFYYDFKDTAQEHHLLWNIQIGFFIFFQYIYRLSKQQRKTANWYFYLKYFLTNTITQLTLQFTHRKLKITIQRWQHFFSNTDGVILKTEHQLSPGTIFENLYWWAKWSSSNPAWMFLHHFGCCIFPACSLGASFAYRTHVSPL